MARVLLTSRLTKKKEKIQAKKRELEASQQMEEERLLAKHKVQRYYRMHDEKPRP